MAHIKSQFGEYMKINPEQITTDSEVLWSKEWIEQATPHHDIICDYLQWKLKPGRRILDIGERNPLTVRLEGRNGVRIENTNVELDYAVLIATGDYDIIICSHVIEHLMNPLFFLKGLTWLMKDDSILYIVAPIKPYWITPAKCHFHEMDFRNFNKLIEKAGLRVVDWKEYSVPIPFKFSIRNWLRRLYNEYSIVALKKND
jgi:SAM-dependent methyltransferase